MVPAQIQGSGKHLSPAPVYDQTGIEGPQIKKHDRLKAVTTGRQHEIVEKGHRVGCELLDPKLKRTQQPDGLLNEIKITGSNEDFGGFVFVFF